MGHAYPSGTNVVDSLMGSGATYFVCTVYQVGDPGYRALPLWALVLFCKVEMITVPTS